MNAANLIEKDPARAVGWCVAICSLVTGLFLLVGPVPVTVSAPTFSIILTKGAIYLYGALLTTAGLAHAVGLSITKPCRRHLSHKLRYWSTFFQFFLFAYLTSVRILVFPAQIIWMAPLTITAIVGILHLRLRLVIDDE